MAIVQTNSGNGSATSTLTYSASAGDIVVLIVGAHSHTNFCKVNGVTDTGGLTWRRRRHERFLFPYTSNSSDRATLDVWWAFAASAQTSKAITVSFDTTSNLDFSQAFYGSFSGVGNTSKPWASDTCGFSQNYGNTSTAQFITTRVDSVVTGDKLIGAFASLTKSPQSVPTLNGTTAMGAGVASTGTAQGVGATSNNAPSGPSTFAWNYNNQQTGYVSIGDTLGISASPAGSDLDTTLQILGTPTFASGSTGASSTLTFQNTAPCTAILTFSTYGVGSYVGISGVTDDAGHTWTRRSRKEFTTVHTDFSGLDHFTMETWWADIPAVHSSNVTITVAKTNTGAEGLSPKHGFFTVIGSPTPTTPWLAGGYNENHADTSSETNSLNPSETYAASNNGDLITSFLQAMVANSGTAPSVGSSPMVSIGIVNVGTTHKITHAAEYKRAAAASETGTMSWTGNTVEYVVQNDVLISIGTGTAQEEPVTGATASGATITASTSIIAGSVNVSEEANVLTITTSIISGTAFEAVTAEGSTLTADIILVAGVAIVDDTADGDTVTVTTSIIAGTASVSEEAALLILSTTLIPGTAFVGAIANGDTIEVDISIIPGELGAGLADGSILDLIMEFRPGSAVSGGIGPGSIIPLIVTLIPGAAFATGTDGTTSGAVLPIFVSILPGEATGESNGDAAGDTITIFTSIQSGAAEAPPAASNGDLLTVGISLIPGTATGTGTPPVQRATGGPFLGRHTPIVDATAQGATITTTTKLEYGRADGQAERIVEVIREVPVPAMGVQLSPVQNDTGRGDKIVKQIMLEAGRATGDAIAFGQMIEVEQDYSAEMAILLLAARL